MAKIRTLSEIQGKWSSVTPQRAGQYRDGVASPLNDWGTNTQAAAQNFEDGVQKAVANKSFQKGVQKAGTAKWQQGAQTLGVSRWPQGVQAAGPAYAQGFEPYREVIDKTTLPPRFPKGDPRNYQRVQAIGEALNKRKVGA